MESGATKVILLMKGMKHRKLGEKRGAWHTRQEGEKGLL